MRNLTPTPLKFWETGRHGRLTRQPKELEIREAEAAGVEEEEKEEAHHRSEKEQTRSPIKSPTAQPAEDASVSTTGKTAGTYSPTKERKGGSQAKGCND
jgi:hypothetical protein